MNRNYKEGAEKVARVGLAMQGAGDLVLSLGSIATGYMGAMSYLQQHIDGLLLQAACTAAALALYFIFDAGKKDLAPFVIAWWLGKKDLDTASEKMPWFFHFFALIALILMIGGSLFSNLVITPEVATTFAGDGSEITNAYSSAIQSTNETYTGDRAIYDQMVTEAQKAVAVIETETQKAVSLSASGELLRLAKGGNQWAKNELAKAEIRAKNKYAGQLRRANKALAKAQADRAEFVAAQGEKVTANVGIIAGQLQTSNAAIMGKYDRYKGLLNWFMVAAAIMFILGTALYVTYEDRTDTVISKDPTAAKVASKVWGKLYGGAIRGLDKLADSKKNGNSVQYAMSSAGASRAQAAPHTSSQVSTFMSAKAITERLRQKSEEENHCVDGNCAIPAQTYRKTDRDSKTETETENRTDRQTDTDKTQKTAEQTDGVGVGQYPDPNDAAAMKALIKRVRAAHTYAKESNGDTDAPKIKDGLAFLQRNGYDVTPRPDGGLTITKYKGTVEKENGEDLVTHGIWEVENE